MGPGPQQVLRSPPRDLAQRGGQVGVAGRRAAGFLDEADQAASSRAVRDDAAGQQARRVGGGTIPLRRSGSRPSQVFGRRESRGHAVVTDLAHQRGSDGGLGQPTPRVGDEFAEPLLQPSRADAPGVRA